MFKLLLLLLDLTQKDRAAFSSLSPILTGTVTQAGEALFLRWGN